MNKNDYIANHTFTRLRKFDIEIFRRNTEDAFKDLRGSNIEVRTKWDDINHPTYKVVAPEEAYLSDCYNAWVAAAYSSTDFIGEYDKLLGRLTVKDLMGEFKAAGEPKDPYTIDTNKFKVFDKIFDMDTACRAPFWSIIYKDFYSM